MHKDLHNHVIPHRIDECHEICCGTALRLLGEGRGTLA